MARRRGRAWGNALGGWRKQRRGRNGQWVKGAGANSRTRAIARRRSSGKRWTGSRDPYVNRKDLNQSIQNRHRKTVLYTETAAMAGAYVGGSFGGALGTAGAGFAGTAIGMQLGASIGDNLMRSLATNTLKSTGTYIDSSNRSISKADRTAILVRETRLQRVHTVANVAMIGRDLYGVHRAVRSTGFYGMQAAKIRKRRGRAQYAQNRGIPMRGTKVNNYTSAGRFGKNKNVYNITSMSGSRVRR